MIKDIKLTDSLDYEFETDNQIEISIIEDLYFEGELARQEMGFSASEYYELPGTREHIKISQKIPLCKCDVIATNRLKIKKSNILSNEEYKQSKSKNKSK